MKKNVAIIYGGDSSEFEISVKSGRQVSACIDRSKYNVYNILLRGENWKVAQEECPDIEIDKSDFSFVQKEQKVKFDIAVIVIHGKPGENGILQSYLELLRIPYVGCNSAVSMLTFDKYACKCFLRDLGIKMAKDVFIRKGQKIDYDAIIAKLGLPLFVKPNDSGSSFGVTKVKTKADMEDAFNAAFAESDAALVEEALIGRELDHGVYKIGNQQTLLPVTEIISQNEFFDYDAKYNGQSNEVTPAVIPNTWTDEIKQTSARIYDYLGCVGIVRVDYIVNETGTYFIEVNTVPGMTEQSIVPQQVGSVGISLTEVFTGLIEDTLNRK